MGFAELEKQALGSTEQSLAGSDPRLASMRRLGSAEAAGLDRLAGRLLAAMTTDRASAHQLCRLCDEPLYAVGPGLPAGRAHCGVGTAGRAGTRPAWPLYGGR